MLIRSIHTDQCYVVLQSEDNTLHAAPCAEPSASIWSRKPDIYNRKFNKKDVVQVLVDAKGHYAGYRPIS